MIPQQTIQEIVEIARVEEVISDFISLKKRGVNYIGLCPFHHEKTPSFTVSPAKGIYKCFGCGKAGNSVNFIMDHEQYSYPEALRYLAKKYAIEIEEEQQTQEQLDSLTENESLFNLSAFAQKYFSELLFSNEDGIAIGMSYFKEREFSPEIIKKFQLGYCLDKWDAFTQHALNNGYKEEHLVKTGLTISGENKLFDRFKGRVIFPIHNISGRVLGFGGRILKKEDNKAKYVNSPESAIYSKSKILYGLFFAKNSIISKDNCFLVEGYTDVISLFQQGIENVVASSGTSLTTEQIKLIRRYTRNITILYDGDPAGIKAAFRGIDMILEEGMNVKIVLFPDGEDPDSFARKHSRDDVSDFVSVNAQDFIRFKTGLLLKEAANDPIKKAELIKEIVYSISLIPDGIARSIYITECGNILTIKEQTLLNELNKIRRQNIAKKNKDEQENEVPEITSFTSEIQRINKDDDQSYQEKDIVRLLLNYGTREIVFKSEDDNKNSIENPINVAAYIVGSLNEDEIKLDDPVYQKIVDEYVNMIESGFLPDDTFFINHPDAELNRVAIDLISVSDSLSPNWNQMHQIEVPVELDVLLQSVVSSVLSLKLKNVDRLISQNQKEIADCTDEDIETLLVKHKTLLGLRSNIATKLGNIIILK